MPQFAAFTKGMEHLLGRLRQAIADADAVAPVMWGFVAVSAVEIPVFHLLIPWGPVRGTSLVLGLWGLF
jgi:hypothetical protein